MHKISLLALLLLLVAHCGTSQADVTMLPQPGVVAPDFDLPAARGGRVRLQALRGQITIISFVATGSAAPSPEADASRSQITVLRSVYDQYHAKSVQIVVIDVANPSSTRDELLNATYDYQLAFPLLQGSADTLERYGVTTVPTTLLIDTKGVITRRWNAIVRTPDLSFAVLALIEE